MDLKEDLKKFIEDYYKHYPGVTNTDGFPSKDDLIQNLKSNGKLKVLLLI